MFQVGIRWHENAGERLCSEVYLNMNISLDTQRKLRMEIQVFIHNKVLVKWQNVHENNFNLTVGRLCLFCFSQGTNGSQLWDTCFAVQAFLEVSHKWVLCRASMLQ